jgi:hypothetical protein
VAGTYSARDYIGASGVGMVFENCAKQPGECGYLHSALLIDAAKQSVPLELWVFDSPITPPADNAAWTVSDADLKNLVGVIPFATYYASALNSASDEQPLSGPKRYTTKVAANLYGYLVNGSGTPTFASGDITIRLTTVADE